METCTIFFLWMIAVKTGLISYESRQGTGLTARRQLLIRNLKAPAPAQHDTSIILGISFRAGFLTLCQPPPQPCGRVFTDDKEHPIYRIDAARDYCKSSVQVLFP